MKEYICNTPGCGWVGNENESLGEHRDYCPNCKMCEGLEVLGEGAADKQGEGLTVDEFRTIVEEAAETKSPHVFKDSDKTITPASPTPTNQEGVEVGKIDYDKIPLEYFIDSLPQNRPLYKDSGTWSIYDDEMKNTIAVQEVNETLREFIIRYFTQFDDDENVMIDFSVSVVAGGF